MAIVRKRLRLEASLCQILQVLSVAPFEEVPILQALEASESQDDFVVAETILLAGALADGRQSFAPRG